MCTNPLPPGEVASICELSSETVQASDVPALDTVNTVLPVEPVIVIVPVLVELPVLACTEYATEPEPFWLPERAREIQGDWLEAVQLHVDPVATVNTSLAAAEVWDLKLGVKE